MLIETPQVKKILDDYDILFESGFMMPVTIDLAKGDTISFDDKAILVHLNSKPSKINPDRMLPAEDITIFTPHIISIQHRSREVLEQTPDEKADYISNWTKITTSPTVQ